MSNSKTELDQSESRTLINDVSDEALETAAAGSGSQNARSFTVTMCTGQTECPF